MVTAGPDDTVARIAALLAEHEISAVPVCDKDGKLLGMLSEGDLMRPFGQENALRRAWWLGMLAEGTDLAPEFLDYVRLDRRRAKDLMTTEVITVTERASAGEIADLMKQAPHQARADRARWQAGGHCQPRRSGPRDGTLAGRIDRCVMSAGARSG